MPLVEMLVAEHAYKPIGGDVLFMGRQTVCMNEAPLEMLLGKYGLRLPAGLSWEYDEETVAARGAPVRLITDRCLMRALGVQKLGCRN